MSQTSSPWPPHLAVWLLRHFLPSNNTESILGDLLEEFSSKAISTNTANSRRWFWRQTLQTVLMQFSANFRLVPGSGLGPVLAGFLLLRFGGGLSERLIFAVLHSFRIYPNHWKLYVFWVTDGLVLGRVLESLLVGGLVGLIAKRREVPAAATLGLVQFLFTEILFFASLLRNGFDFPFLPQLFLSLLINALAVLLGGYIVQEIRAARTHLLAVS